MKEFCPIVQSARKLAVRQGLDASLVDCPKICDRKEPCPPSMVEIFNARINKARDLLDARINGQYHSDGTKI